MIRYTECQECDWYTTCWYQPDAKEALLIHMEEEHA